MGEQNKLQCPKCYGTRSTDQKLILLVSGKFEMFLFKIVRNMYVMLLFSKRLNTTYLTSISQKNFIYAFSNTRMLASCGHTWWRKPENPGKITDLGRATTSLLHADTGIRSLIAAVASECFNNRVIQAPKG